jgi:sulfur carrier protein
LQECFFNFGEVKMEVLKINGVEKQFPAGQLPSTVAELLERLDIEAATAAAEVDGQIIERTKFVETNLRNGQSIELVRFVGGG